MELVSNVNDTFKTPSEYACPMYMKAIEEDSCIDSILARLLYVVQAVASLVVLPFLLLAGIIQACTEDNKLQTLKETVLAMGFQCQFFQPLLRLNLHLK